MASQALHDASEAEGRAALCELCGVGRKVADRILIGRTRPSFPSFLVQYHLVRERELDRTWQVADCILLFGYAHDGCVPVDCHCFQISERYLLPSIRGKSLSAGVYEQASHSTAEERIALCASRFGTDQ